MEKFLDKESSVFKKNYEKYMEEIRKLDFEEVARRHNLKFSDGALYIPFFHKNIKVDNRGIYDETGKIPMYSICVVIAKYLLMAPTEIVPQNSWVTYKDFKDSAPFAVAFTNNVEKVIVKRFSNKLDQLKDAAQKLGGYISNELGSAYDLIMRFAVLPNFDLLLTFNDEDEEFPAEAKVLFPDNSDKILDMECLAICGWLLSDFLYILSGGKGYTIM